MQPVPKVPKLAPMSGLRTTPHERMAADGPYARLPGYPSS